MTVLFLTGDLLQVFLVYSSLNKSPGSGIMRLMLLKDDKCLQDVVRKEWAFLSLKREMKLWLIFSERDVYYKIQQQCMSVFSAVGRYFLLPKDISSLAVSHSEDCLAWKRLRNGKFSLVSDFSFCGSPCQSNWPYLCGVPLYLGFGVVILKGWSPLSLRYWSTEYSTWSNWLLSLILMILIHHRFVYEISYFFFKSRLRKP